MENVIWNIPINYGSLKFIEKNQFNFELYGTPQQPLNGGRAINMYKDAAKLFGAKYIDNNPFEECLNLNYPINLVASKYHATQDDIIDEVKILLSKVKGALISSDIVYDFISSNYPKLIKICSMLKSTYERPLDILKWYEKILPYYDRIVLNTLDTNLAYDLPPEKFEIMVNEPCKKNCPKRKEHYELFDKYEKDGNNLQELLYFCDRNFTDTTILSLEEIDNLYNYGYRHFKIEGRFLDSQIVYDNLDHFVNRNLPDLFS
jgi:hypothetical protein